jgi:hypothetical protein
MRTYTGYDPDDDNQLQHGSVCVIHIPTNEYILVNDNGDVALYTVQGELKSAYNVHTGVITIEKD